MKECRQLPPMERPETRRSRTAHRLLIGVGVVLALMAALPAAGEARRYSTATYSSPIALSANGRYVWNVNPGAGTVTVIYTKTNKLLATIKVGDEPQSIALDPNNRYAYVANAGLRHRSR